MLNGKVMIIVLTVGLIMSDYLTDYKPGNC